MIVVERKEVLNMQVLKIDKEVIVQVELTESELVDILHALKEEFGEYHELVKSIENLLFEV